MREIVAENKQKKKVASLEDFALEIVAEPKKDFNNAMGQESLTRFDQPKKKKRPNKNKKVGEKQLADKKPAGKNIIKPNNSNPKPNNPNSNPKIIPNKKNEPKK